VERREYKGSVLPSYIDGRELIADECLLKKPGSPLIYIYITTQLDWQQLKRPINIHTHTGLFYFIFILFHFLYIRLNYRLLSCAHFLLRASHLGVKE
jgi:hypothetical protein